MNDIVVTQGFEDLLEDDTILAGLKTFALDFEAELSGLLDFDIDRPSTLSSTLIQFSGQSLDTTLPQPYTVSLTGSGFTPVSSLGAFETAIMDGTAAGDVQSIRVAYGGTEILSLDVDRNSYLLTSGDQSIERGGTFPSSLQEFGTLINISESFDNLFLLTQEEIEALLQPLLQYELTDLVLRDAGAELLSMSVDSAAGTLTAEADGYTLTAAFPTMPLAGMPGLFDPTAPIIGFGVGPITLTDPKNDIILQIPDTIPLNPLDLESFLQDLEARTGLTLPPLPEGLTGWNSGDPHLLTLDGAAYDFHAAGEYVMIRATDGSEFQVQARMSPVGENVTANVAAAVKLDGGAVMVDPAAAAPLSIAGTATTVPDGGFISVGQDRIYREGDTYTLIHTRDGSLDTGYSAIEVDIIGQRVDITVALDTYWAGQVEGLLGNADGFAANDIALADGTPLSRPLAFADLYGTYRDDWRVDDAADSLFTYANGEGPDSYYLPNYPTGMIGLNDFDSTDVTAAQNAVTAAGLQQGTPTFDQAVLDYLLTGDDSYVDSARNAQDVIDNRPLGAPPLDTPDTDGGGLEGLLVLSGTLTAPGGEDMSAATVTFQPTGRSVGLARVTRGDGDFRFDLVENETGRLDATRDYDADSDPAITAGDALEVLRLAVGLTPSFGEPRAQNFVAADMNGDGRVTAGDALEVLRHAVGLDSEHAPQWQFFDSGTDWANLGLDRENTAVARGVEVGEIDADIALPPMTGILLGNMDTVVT
ncbi:VWD domain-containing protein [Roseovarius tibetensis]|uniref:VWD domain-containing protein n=1 Tax=Roseovarius tibetensis TaxID=2685897 RepID=UPI003D7FF331